MTNWLSKVSDIGGADWQELTEPQQSPQMTLTRNGQTIVRYFRIPSADFDDFAADCFDTLPSGALTPRAHPLNSSMLIDTISATPLAPEYDEAESSALSVNVPVDWLATVTYSPWLSDPSPIAAPDPTNPLDLYTANLQFGVEVMTIPGYSLKWESTGTAIKAEQVQAILKIPITNFDLLIPRSRVIPWGAIRASRGCVNKSVFWGGAPETILYNGASVSARFYSDGSKTFEISHSFTEKVIRWGTNTYGWNHVWDSSDVLNPGWDRPLDKTSDKPLYLLTDTFPNLLVI